MTPKVVIIGAGIAGLSAARACALAAKSQRTAVEITVLEAGTEVGGKAQTIKRDGWLLEAGPTGYLNSPATAALMAGLAEDAGLKTLSANGAAARRFLVRGTRMREIKLHPLRFATSGILGPIGLARLATEPLRKQRQSTGDESVWDFAARRLGRQAADRLVAPMVLGVFAGDAKRTSLAAAFPRMVELERDYGSLIKAMVALKRGGAPPGELTSFKGGLACLPQALAAKAQAEDAFAVHCSSPVTAIHRGSNANDPTWRITCPHRELEADVLIIATECFAAADLLAGITPRAAEELRGIPTPAVNVVGLGFGQAALAKAPIGFGALIQRGGPIRILGALFDTHLFPGRSPEGALLVRCMIGGATNPELDRLGDEELISLAHQDVCRVLKLKGPAAELRFKELVRWPRAIPQYSLGHQQRITRLQSEIARQTGLFLAGNYLDGVAFAKAASSGHEAGAAAMAQLFSSLRERGT